MKSSAFLFTLYPVQVYVISFQRAQLLLTGASHGHRHRACVDVCARASITGFGDSEPQVSAPLQEITMACDQKARARG